MRKRCGQKQEKKKHERSKKRPRRERAKKIAGEKRANARRNKKTEECGRAFAYCYVNARARSNNRHQAQWWNPGWKGGQGGCRSRKQGLARDAGGETLSHYRIAAPRCRDSLCPYVNSCKQRFTPIQPWVPDTPSLLPSNAPSFLSFFSSASLRNHRRVNGRRRVCRPL